MDLLNAEIARVERRLLEREADLKRRLGELRRGAGSALRPRRSAVPWASLLLLAWPLLPRALRPRLLRPSTAMSMLGLGLPLAKRLLVRRRAEPATVAQVDLPRYMGLWHEVARLPNTFQSGCVGQPTAHYAAAPFQEGVPWVEVVNRCLGRGGRVREVRGVARMVRGSGGARLKVSFLPRALRWWPGAWGDYWILHVDADYSEALVGEPGRSCLWVLSRTPTLAPARLQALLTIARSQGFDVDRLHMSEPTA